MGVLVDDPEFADCVVEQYDRLADPVRSYRVELKSGRLVWDGGDRRVSHEPGATWRQRLICGLVGWLPMEAQL